MTDPTPIEIPEGAVLTTMQEAIRVGWVFQTVTTPEKEKWHSRSVPSVTGVVFAKAPPSDVSLARDVLVDLINYAIEENGASVNDPIIIAAQEALDA